MSVRLGRVANGWFLVDHYAEHLTVYEVQEVRDLNIEISFYDSYDSLSSMSQVSVFFPEK